jgi:DNA modification methylase
VTLPTLEPNSVQACVTSPPYYGLRDYGTDPLVWGGDAEHTHEWGDEVVREFGRPQGKTGDRATRTYTSHGYAVDSICPCGAWLGNLGLEPTPDLFVEHLVEVFREVRRVLRDDGVLWLNLGSSYFGGGKGPTGQNGIGDQSARQGWSGSRRGPAYGNGDKARSSSPDPDSSCSDLCDECRAVLSNHSAGRLPHHPASASLVAKIDRGTEPLDSAGVPVGVFPLDALGSTTPESLLRPPVECSHCANCDVCLLVQRSSLRDGRLCARKTAYTNGTFQSDGQSAFRTSDTAPSSTAWGNSTSPHPYKPKDEMLLPFRVALALQRDGWYVRSVIPWLKRNSMPESVTDRPATAVEYVFLLSKASRYFWDADAVRVPSDPSRTRFTPGKKFEEVHDTTGRDVRNDGLARLGQRMNDGLATGRNWRNADAFFQSWQGLLLDEQDDPLALIVNPAPFSGAHFATFPPKLVEPMVKASTRPGDTVLDPFGGAGTVGLVADRLQRNAILCELKPDYGEMSTQRITNDAPLFTEVDGGGELVQPEPLVDKQAASGLRRYAGFNARWNAKEAAE